MAFTFPDRPSPLVTSTTPATNFQNVPDVDWSTPTFGTSFVPSPNCHGGRSCMPTMLEAGVDFNVKQEHLLTASKAQHSVKDVTSDTDRAF